MVISSCIFCLGYYSLCPVEQAHTKMLHWWSCGKRRVSHPGATGLHVYLTTISTDSNFTIDCLWLYIVSVFFGCWAKLEKITQKQDKSTNSNMRKQDSSEPALCILPLLLCMLPLYHALCCCYCANHSWLPLPVLKNKQVILDSY